MPVSNKLIRRKAIARSQVDFAPANSGAGAGVSSNQSGLGKILRVKAVTENPSHISSPVISSSAAIVDNANILDGELVALCYYDSGSGSIGKIYEWKSTSSTTGAFSEIPTKSAILASSAMVFCETDEGELYGRTLWLYDFDGNTWHFFADAWRHSPHRTRVIAVTTDSVLMSDELLLADTGAVAGAITLTLPPASASIIGKVFRVYDIGNNANVNNVIINRNGSTTDTFVGGATSVTLAVARRMVWIECIAPAQWGSLQMQAI